MDRNRQNIVSEQGNPRCGPLSSREWSSCRRFLRKTGAHRSGSKPGRPGVGGPLGLQLSQGPQDAPTSPPHRLPGPRKICLSASRLPMYWGARASVCGLCTVAPACPKPSEVGPALCISMTVVPLARGFQAVWPPSLLSLLFRVPDFLRWSLRGPWPWDVGVPWANAEQPWFGIKQPPCLCLCDESFSSGV